MSVARFEVKRRPSEVRTKGASDGQTRGYPDFGCLGRGDLTVLLCKIDDAYRILNPLGSRYDSLKRLSDSEVSSPSPFSSKCVGISKRNWPRRG